MQFIKTFLLNIIFLQKIYVKENGLTSGSKVYEQTPLVISDCNLTPNPLMMNSQKVINETTM